MRTHVVAALTLNVITGLYPQQSSASSTEQDAQDQPVPESFRPRNWFGYGSTWIGDVNSDGWHDVAVPDSTYTPEGEPIKSYGVVLILSGADGSVLNVLHPNEGESSFGWATAMLDDLDEDGFGEVLVFGRSGKGEDERSFARAISPVTGRVHWQKDGLPEGTWTSGMRSAGDFNGDSHEDILAWGGIPQGSSGTTSSAKTVVLSGQNGAFISEVSMTREGWNSIMDACLVPDLDGDKKRDMAVALFQDDGVAGRRIVEIRASSSGALLRSIANPGRGRDLGESLAVADLNGDGIEELLVAASDVPRYEVDKKAGLDCVYVFDLTAGDASFSRLSVPGAAGEKVIAVVADLRDSPATESTALVAPEVLDHRWPGSKALLLVADDRSFHGEVRCFSLSTGARRWNLGGKDSTMLDRKPVLTDRLGACLALASTQDSHGLPALVGTANHTMDKNHTIVCFDALSGEPRFVLDARAAYERAGLFLRRDFPTSASDWVQPVRDD